MAIFFNGLFSFLTTMMIINYWNTSSSNYSSSADEIADNEDLLLQVLLCLPVKSLLRFRTVSKKWKSLISAQSFAFNHTRRNPNPVSTGLMMLRGQSLILVSLGQDQSNCCSSSYGTVGFRSPTFDFFNTTPDTLLRIICFCNGLMLCSLTTVLSRESTVYCVSNITTRKFIQIPHPGQIIKQTIFSVALAFDPSRTPHFKAICHGQHYSEPDSECEMEIYSSETGSWKRWKGTFANRGYVLETFDRGVYCNSAIHWLCSKGDSFYFNFEDETMRVLQMPPVHRDLYTTKRLRYLGQSGGFLHLVDVEANLFQNLPLDVYEMGKDYGGWSLKYRVKLDDIGMRFPEMVGEMELNPRLADEGNGYLAYLARYYLCAVLSVIRGEHGVSVEIIMLIPHRIISYNPEYNRIKVLLCFEEFIDIQDNKWYDIHQFIESLTLLPNLSTT